MLDPAKIAADTQGRPMKCGWCGRDAIKVAKQKTCSRHEQCTKVLREYRASLAERELPAA